MTKHLRTVTKPDDWAYSDFGDESDSDSIISATDAIEQMGKEFQKPQDTCSETKPLSERAIFFRNFHGKRNWPILEEQEEILKEHAIKAGVFHSIVKDPFERVFWVNNVETLKLLSNKTVPENIRVPLETIVSVESVKALKGLSSFPEYVPYLLKAEMTFEKIVACEEESSMPFIQHGREVAKMLNTGSHIDEISPLHLENFEELMEIAQKRAEIQHVRYEV